MEKVELVEKHTIFPQTPTPGRRMFLSNIDLTLVSYYETVEFFMPPPEPISFQLVSDKFCDAISRLLVIYDFLAGRLERSLDDSNRLEINCNDAGVVVVTATTTAELSALGDLRAPKPEFKQMVRFLQEEKHMELRDKPLFLLQLTRFRCGGIALGGRINHCTQDGFGVYNFLANLAAFTRGEGLLVAPDSDRTIFKARIPPKILFPHFEYSKLDKLDLSFSTPGTLGCLNFPEEHQQQQQITNIPHLLYLPPERIACLKSLALKDKDPQSANCTTFQCIAAKLWKVQAALMGIPDDEILTMLFPVDIHHRMKPNLSPGFAGNALVPGFARATVSEIKTRELCHLVQSVKEGLERIDDEYVRSAMDWLEVHRGVPCREASFSVVAWSRLGLEGQEFWWGTVQSLAPVEVKPGLVMLLPGDKKGDGLHICLELPPGNVKEFNKLMMEED